MVGLCPCPDSPLVWDRQHSITRTDFPSPAPPPPSPPRTSLLFCAPLVDTGGCLEVAIQQTLRC